MYLTHKLRTQVWLNHLWTSENNTTNFMETVIEKRFPLFVCNVLYAHANYFMRINHKAYHGLATMERRVIDARVNG